MNTIIEDGAGAPKTCFDCLRPIKGPAFVRITEEGTLRTYHHAALNCSVFAKSETSTPLPWPEAVR
jgi:hypothetical protein